MNEPSVFESSNVYYIIFLNSLQNSSRMSESLLNATNYLNPSPWNAEQILCVCPDAQGTLEGIICSASEAETCLGGSAYSGVQPATETRTKRHAYYINYDIERRLDSVTKYVSKHHANRRKV